MLIKRILMNAADQGGSGGGQPPPAGGTTPPAAPAPAPQTPAQPQAQGAAPATIDIKALAAEVAAAVTPVVKDSLFAEARRAGMLPGNKPKAPSDGQAPAAPAAPDLSKLRSLDRVLNRTGLATSLSEQQYGRLERDYVAEAPDNAEDWVKAYFPGSSGSPANPQAPASPASAPAASPAATPNPTPQPANAIPVTDRGSPPVPRAPLEERPLVSLSPGEREELRQRHGDAWFSDTLHKQLRAGGQRFTIR